jgi:hypothetical protein
MFIAAIFTIVKIWCPSTNECVKKKKTYIYIYMMEYYSAIKKNEIMSFAGKCIELELEIIL